MPVAPRWRWEAGVLRGNTPHRRTQALEDSCANDSGVHPVLLVAILALLRPSQHGDFGHYTFALMWQPGICSTEGGCTADQPHATLIGLHGLWASRPRALVAKGVPVRVWWSRGCDYYAYSTAPPPIPAQLRRELDAVMPHFRHSLLTHVSDKHVRCFGFDPALFFSTELAMRYAVVSSGFGRYLVAHRGERVTQSALGARFESAFTTRDRTSLQLQCGRDASGRTVLTQFWITIRSQKLARFPRSGSLMDAIQNQTNCPASFLLPNWR